MSYLHYMCLLVYCGVQRILCYVFVLFVLVYVASFSGLSNIKTGSQLRCSENICVKCKRSSQLRCGYFVTVNQIVMTNVELL
jgi:hypothetical protein